jgi:hypothetical protein
MIAVFAWMIAVNCNAALHQHLVGLLGLGTL